MNLLIALATVALGLISIIMITMLVAAERRAIRRARAEHDRIRAMFDALPTPKDRR